MQRPALAVLVALGACSEPKEVESVAAEAEPSSRHVDVGGARIHLLEAGEGREGTVLLLHGRAFQASTWSELGTLRHLADEGFRALAVDLPGFGDSQESGLEPEAFLGALLDALDVERPVLVSPSMSGVFSLPFAVRRPAELAGYVPIAPAALDRYEAELPKATVPTFILWGEKDELLSPDLADRMAELLPNANKAILDGARHPCYLDRPEEFHGLLTGFARRVLAPSSER